MQQTKFQWRKVIGTPKPTSCLCRFGSEPTLRTSGSALPLSARRIVVKISQADYLTLFDRRHPRGGAWTDLTVYEATPLVSSTSSDETVLPACTWLAQKLFCNRL